MTPLLAIAIGGAAGSVLRYGFQQAFAPDFPTGTLAVNLLGCLLIGVLWAASEKGLGENLRLLLMTGFCGGFTTLSAFSLESLQLMTTGRWAAFLIYFFATVAGGLLATFTGYQIFRS